MAFSSLAPVAYATHAAKREACVHMPPEAMLHMMVMILHFLYSSIITMLGAQNQGNPVAESMTGSSGRGDGLGCGFVFIAGGFYST